jgi:CubicO group peptidase (beta-lactamase class C family)
MNNTWFNIPEKDAARVANIYRRTPNGLEKGGQLAIGTQVYFSGAGGLTCTAEDYLQFAQMLGLRMRLPFSCPPLASRCRRRTARSRWW